MGTGERGLKKGDWKGGTAEWGMESRTGERRLERVDWRLGTGEWVGSGLGVGGE